MDFDLQATSPKDPDKGSSQNLLGLYARISEKGLSAHNKNIVVSRTAGLSAIGSECTRLLQDPFKRAFVPTKRSVGALAPRRMPSALGTRTVKLSMRAAWAPESSTPQQSGRSEDINMTDASDVLVKNT